MRILRIAVAAALAAGTVVGGLALSAAPASADVPASTPIQYVTRYFWGGNGSAPVTGAASCPSGDRVVSSGASAPGGQLAGLAPDINYHNAATATAYVPFGYMGVTVGCEPFAATSEVTSWTIGLPYGSGFRRGVVVCPAGMHAFGGGGYMAKPNGHISTDSYGMVSNTVTGDGRGWTFAASTTAKESLVVTTQCAPLTGSYVSQTPTPAPYAQQANVYGSCLPGYTALSGGVYLSRPDAAEVQNGYIDYSIPASGASGTRWYVDGTSYQDSTGDKLIAAEQCIR